MHTARLESGGTLLERETELAEIEAGLAGAQEGEGSLLLIEGPAGIGKTHLLSAARERAVESGIDVFDARGGELERSLAFGIVRQLFESRLAAASANERAELLSGAASLAGAAFGYEIPQAPKGGPTLSGDPAASIHHGLYWLCANLAERTPLLLLVDDLHWADPVSVRWLMYLARRLDGLALLALTAARSGEPGPFPELAASLTSERTVRVLRPEPLTEAATTELVRARLGSEADPAFCAACFTASGGNPFLLGELLEAIRADRIAPIADSAAAVEALAPETVSRSTLLRIARLPPAATPLARAVAILGTEAEPRHAAKLAGVDEEAAAEGADAMAAASLLARGVPLRFAHPLLRVTVYEQIPDGERALGHARAARILFEEGASPERIAAHLLHAGPIGERWAVEMLADAATAATARGAPDAAIAYLRCAFQDPVSAPMRIELLSDLLDAGVAAGQPSILEEVSDDPIAELTATPELVVASVLRLGMWLFTVARFDEANEVFDRAIAEAAKEGRHDLALRFDMQRLSVIPVRAADAIARLERHAVTAELGTPEDRLWLAQRALWETSTVRSDARRAADLAKGALAEGQIFAEQVDTASVGQAILVLIWADELDAAETWIEYGSADARRRGSRFGFTGMAALRSQLAYRRGDLQEAVESAGTAIEIAREHGNLLSIPVYAAWLVEAMIERGRLDDAERELTRSGLTGELPDHWWFSPVRFSRAALRLARGSPEQAVDDLRGLVRLAEQGEPAPAVYPAFALTALTLHALGQDGDEQLRLVEQEVARARQWGTARVMGTALRAKGVVEDGERAIELLAEAAQVLEGSPARLEHARTLVDWGAALRRANRRREARGPLRQGLDLATRCGATAIAERAREELAATGAKPRRVMLTGVESLTPSELRIARLAGEGMTNKEIAQALFITVKTVEMHLGRAYGKLGISSRKELPGALGSEPLRSGRVGER